MLRTQKTTRAKSASIGLGGNNDALRSYTHHVY